MTAASRRRIGHRPPAERRLESRSHGPPWRLRLEQLLLPVVVQFEPVARSFGGYVKVLGDNGR